MKQRIEAPVFTWFLVAAVLFSALTFLLGIWVCSNAPRAGYDSEDEVPTVVEHPESLDMENTSPTKENSVSLKSTANKEPGQHSTSTPGKTKKVSESAKKTKKTQNKAVVKKVTQRKKHSGKIAKTKVHRKEKSTITSRSLSKKIYYIQLIATANRKMAEKMKQTYAAKGYNMYLLKGKKHGNLLYKVRIGVFKDWKKAKAIAEKIRREDKIKPWIIAM